MSKLSLSNLANLQNENTAISTINANNDNIVTALENTLSRDGTTPNTMSATLDMNSNRIINLPDAISISEPINLGYLNDILDGANLVSGLVDGVPVSAAMQPVLNASTLEEAIELLGIHTVKNALDFGAVGDGITDNADAADDAIAFINDTGGYVYWPQGSYRFTRSLDTITSGGFIGAGFSTVGGYFNVMNEPFGTIFRSDFTTGDLITIPSPSFATTIMDIGFWPLAYRGLTNYEIAVGSTSGTTNSTNIQRCGFWYCGAPIVLYNAIQPIIRDCWFFATYGAQDILTTGNTVRTQGPLIDSCVFYNPYPGGVEPPTAANCFTSWTAGMAVTASDVMVLSGNVWNAVVGGNTALAGSGPTPQAYTTSSGTGSPLATEVVDGDVHWVLIGQNGHARVRIESYSQVVWITNCQILDSCVGVQVSDSVALSGSGPEFIRIVNCLINNTALDGCQVNGGIGFAVANSTVNYSAAGRGITAQIPFVTLSNTDFHNHALDGVLLTGGSQHRVNGCVFGNNSKQTANTYSGLVVNSCHDVLVTGNIASPTPNIGAVHTQKYGVSLTGTTTRTLVTANNLYSNGTGASFDGSSGTNSITGNIS
jgi:hypothetical protein